MPRVVELLSAYKTVATREKAEKDRKKYTVPKRRPFQQASGMMNVATSALALLGSSANSATTGMLGGGDAVGSSLSTLAPIDKYGILSAASRRNKTNMLSGGSSVFLDGSSQQTLEMQLKALLKPAVTVENFDPLPEEYWTTSFNTYSGKKRFLYVTVKLKN